MKFRNIDRLAYAATAVGLALASPGHAQTVEGGIADESTAAAVQSDANAIVVTARRVEENLQDVPISITVFDQEQLTKRNITAANDLATYTPSLSSNERFGQEKSSFAIRGFNQEGETDPTVGVYFAEVVGVRAAGGTTSGSTVGAGAFMDLENVQVLKGPQGTLFGRNTTGGAVLLVPRKPTADFEGYIEGSAGNYDMHRIQGALNIPLAETFKVRLAADHMKRDGYLRNRSGIGPDAYNDRNYLGLRASVVADLTPDLENYIIVQYTKSDTNGFANRLVGCNRDTYDAIIAGAPSITNTTGLHSSAACEQVIRQEARGDSLLDVEVGAEDAYLELTQWQIINKTTWQATDELTIKNTMSYGQFYERTRFQLYSDNFFVSPFIGNLFGFIPLTGGTPYDYVQLDTPDGRDTAAQETFVEELQLQYGSADGRFNGVLGGYLEFARPLGSSTNQTAIFLNCDNPTEPATCVNPFPGIGNLTVSSQKKSFDNHGVFAQGTFKLSDKFALTAGARYTWDKIFGVDQSIRRIGAGFNTITCRNTQLPVTPPITDASQCSNSFTVKSQEPTWLVNLDFTPTEDLLLYAKYARGYRQGTLTFLNPGLETSSRPEKLDSYELGLKASFFGPVRGYLNVAAFYNDLSDQQVRARTTSSADPRAAGGNPIVNAGKSVVKGVEVDASITLFDSLNLTLGYAYLDTEVKEVPARATPGDGTPLGELLTGTVFDSLTPLAVVGERLPYTPKHKLTLTATYTIPVPETWGDLSVGATFIYVGDQLTDPAFFTNPAVNDINTSATGGFIPVRDTVAARLPSYKLLNLNLDLERIGGSPFDLSLFATNVTNEIYAVSTGGAFEAAGIVDAGIAPPRMYGLRIRYNFGPGYGGR